MQPDPISVLHRYPLNPILSPEDVPGGPMLVFNVGVVKYQSRYVMAYRSDFGSRDFIDTTLTQIGFAFSDDGIHWTPRAAPLFTLHDDENLRAYDPRRALRRVEYTGRCIPVIMKPQ